MFAAKLLSIITSTYTRYCAPNESLYGRPTLCLKSNETTKRQLQSHHNESHQYYGCMRPLGLIVIHNNNHPHNHQNRRSSRTREVVYHRMLVVLVVVVGSSKMLGIIIRLTSSLTTVLGRILSPFEKCLWWFARHRKDVLFDILLQTFIDKHPLIIAFHSSLYLYGAFCFHSEPIPYGDTR